MNVDIKDACSGDMDGQYVWVCDFRHTDPHQKAARHVKPTKVLIRPLSDTKQRVNYSHSFFSPLSKNGDPKATVIKPYDNTGYRSFAGIPINVFTTEKECVDKYNSQVDTVIADLNRWVESTRVYAENQLTMLQGLKS